MKYRGVPGHEFAGRVIESQSSALRGKRVVGEINAGCGAMRELLRRSRATLPQSHRARNPRARRRFCGVSQAARLNLIPIPDSIPDDLAVFVEPLAAAYEIFEQFILRGIRR